VRRGLRRLLAVAAAAMLAGCYITRGAYEEARILWNRRPISQVIANPELDPEIRTRLQTVLTVREFARDHLGLKTGDAYTTVSPVDSGAIVYVVMAAPRDSLEPYEWWFPIVGYVPYRGYFKESEAHALAAHLEEEGYDTMVRPAVAFSSLGFFNDPLLSNLLELNRVELAGVITHELFHRTYFLASNVIFDESAANYVGSRGAVEFFKETEGDSSPDTVEARGIFESDMKFSHFLLQAEAKLLWIYDSDLSKDEKLKRREAAFDQIKSDYAKLKPTLSGLERFDLDKEPLNNAVLLNYLIYFHELDDFAALERANHGDLRATIARIIELAKANPDDPFYAIWDATREAVPNQPPLELLPPMR
jgi:predicted aminopeptidase